MNRKQLLGNSIDYEGATESDDRTMQEFLSDESDNGAIRGEHFEERFPVSDEFYYDDRPEAMRPEPFSSRTMKL